jgi:hypothetical protein
VWLTKSVPPGTRVTVSQADGEMPRRFETAEVGAKRKSGAA